MGKRIIFEFYNSFTTESLGDINLVYDRTKAVNNYYSKLWKKFKLFLAKEYRLDKHWVRVKITFK